ncbi:SDR family oxidoreductase [Undibacterium sp. TJN25]|uniref:SDR family oxidoreductase n=1 Tax=Undibacterium sp. TJN25 TaxID=3413056 RepID=UPI003BEFC093
MKKTVLITGCSSGFGKTSALYFARQGWNVIATMRNTECDAGADLAAMDGVLVTRLDVQDAASIDQAVAAGIARFDRIDALVNNAGFGLFGVFEAMSGDKIREQFDVNVFGVMDVTRALLPHFRHHKAGTIINISSGAGVFTLPMISLYSASKFALEGFSESLSYELAPLGITVKVVEPGGVISTSFGQRSGAEAGHASTLPDYDAFITATSAVFAGLRGQRLATEEDVAKVIYQAATDGTDQLRYVATDDIKPLVKARRESTEADYMQLMRSQFMMR